MNFPIIFGDRSEALFDLWSLQHCLSGVILGTFFFTYEPLLKRRKGEFYIYVLYVALCWEAVEYAMELGWFGQGIATWKGSIEYWGNRLIGDPLMVTLGAFIALRFEKSWRLVFVPAALWLLINVAAPHSMYVQRLLFELFKIYLINRPWSLPNQKNKIYKYEQKMNKS